MSKKRAKDGEAKAYLRDVVLKYEDDECLAWPFGNIKGYGRIGNNLVSRVVCEDVHGPAPTPLHQAAHSCGKGHEGCVTKRHLSWKTRAENEADKITHGTHNRGSRHGVAKLTEDAVKVIRSLRGVEYQRETARRFGVDQSIISEIQTGKIWTHV